MSLGVSLCKITYKILKLEVFIKHSIKDLKSNEINDEIFAQWSFRDELRGWDFICNFGVDIKFFLRYGKRKIVG